MGAERCPLGMSLSGLTDRNRLSTSRLFLSFLLLATMNHRLLRPHLVPSNIALRSVSTGSHTRLPAGLRHNASASYRQMELAYPESKGRAPEEMLACQPCMLIGRGDACARQRKWGDEEWSWLVFFAVGGVAALWVIDNDTITIRMLGHW